MLTKMTEEDWTTVLQVFEASRSRRGETRSLNFLQCESLLLMWWTAPAPDNELG